MSGLDGRMDRLYPDLSARERAILVLEAAHEDRDPDFRIRWTMPDSQAEEFNGYIAQLRGVARCLGPYALVLEQEVAHARTQLLLVAVLVMWGSDRSELLSYIQWQTDEPCTQEEFDQHLASARADDLSLDFAVDAVIDTRGLWSEEEGEDPHQQAVRFKQLSRPIEAELRELVAQKQLQGHGRGARLNVKAGSLYDWLKQPSPVPAEWGRGYEVVADDEVGWRREWRARVHDQIKAGPHAPIHVLPAMAPTPAWLPPDADLTAHDLLLRTLAERLRVEIARLSGAFGALDTVLEEVRVNLGGHDPAHPILRDAVTRAAAGLHGIRDDAPPLLGTLDPTDCDAVVLEQLRVLVHEQRSN